MTGAAKAFQSQPPGRAGVTLSLANPAEARKNAQKVVPLQLESMNNEVEAGYEDDSREEEFPEQL